MRRLLLAAGAVALVALAGPLAPHDPDAIDLAARHAGPSALHPLGTDQLGRDLMSRLLVGLGRSAGVALLVGSLGFGGGALLGTAAALLGGRGEAALLRLAEMTVVVPTLIVALCVGAALGLTPVSAGLALGLAGLGPHALLAHALARRALGLPYVQAARALGVGGPRLLARHVLPASLPVLLASVGAQAGQTVVAYASLAFIGLGADPTVADLGAMLFEYRGFLFDHPELTLWPGLAIALLAGAAHLAFDPGEARSPAA